MFSRGQYIGPLSELEDLVQPLIDAAGTPVKTTLTTMRYWDMQRMFASAETAAARIRRHLPLLLGTAAGPRRRQGG